MKDLFVEIEKCLGCCSCEIACAVEHSSSRDLYSLIQELPETAQRIQVEKTAYGPLPVRCHHCEDAPCVEACMASAMHRDESTGRVCVDTERCVGCWMCVMVCPFGAILPNAEAKTAHKCDLCKDSDEIACVNACPTNALTFRESRELVSSKRWERARVLI